MGLFLTVRKQKAIYLERDEKGAHLFGPCGTQHTVCSGCGACGAGAAAPLSHAGEVPAGTEEGDLCEVEVEAANPAVAGFVVFFLPLVFAALGAFLGATVLAGAIGVGTTPGMVIGAVAGLSLSWALSLGVSKLAAGRARGIISIVRIGEPGA